MGIPTQFSNKGKQVKTVWALQSILSQGKSENQASIQILTSSSLYFFIYLLYFHSFLFTCQILFKLLYQDKHNTTIYSFTHYSLQITSHAIFVNQPSNHFSITNN